MKRRPTANPRDFVLSLVVWIAGTLTASHFADAYSLNLRIFAVALAVTSALPWAALVVGGIREADEFSRRVHMLALGIAFGGVSLTVIIVDWLQRARLIDGIRLGGMGLLVVWLWWGVGMIAARKHYQ